MTTSLFVNADWSAIVPAGSPEAAFGIQPKDAKRLGLTPLEAGEDPELESAETKAAGKVANKAAAKPENKGAARKEDTDGDGN